MPKVPIGTSLGWNRITRCLLIPSFESIPRPLPHATPIPYAQLRVLGAALDLRQINRRVFA
eukprot:2218174-Rhodomonas_salina.2